MFLVRFFREVEQEEKQHILCPFPACTLFQPAKNSTPRGLSITVFFFLALRAILSLHRPCPTSSTMQPAKQITSASQAPQRVSTPLGLGLLSNSCFFPYESLDVVLSIKESLTCAFPSHPSTSNWSLHLWEEK